MKIRTLAIAAVLAAGPTAVQTLNAQAIEPGLSAADIALTQVLAARWMDARPGDFAAAKLIADPSAVPASHHVESATVQFAWPLTETPASDFALPQVDSLQYWVDATGEDLAKGIDLPLTAAGAVIRISPLVPDAKVRIAPEGIELALDGNPLDASAIARLADGAALKAAGLDVPEASLAFKLGPEVGAGSLKLGVGALPADEHMVIHVFEPESPWSGQLTLTGRNFFAGDGLSVGFGIGDGKSALPVDTIRALVTGPNAERQFELALDPVSGVLRGELPKDLDLSGQAGLFEAHAWLETTTPEGLQVRRDLKIPFSVAPALARLDGRAAARLGDALTLDIGVETAAAGRFQLNAQVFGTGADGQLVPMAMAQTAGMVPAGGGTLQLKVDREIVEASGLGAPFEIRGVELLDQGRMFLLQRQQEALRLVR